MSRSPQKLSSSLWEIGALLELSDASRRRSRGFYDMAAHVSSLSPPLSVELLEADETFQQANEEVQGVVTAFVSGQDVGLLQELTSEFSIANASLLRVNGIGAKTARVILSTLEVESLEELLVATQNGDLPKVRGIGKKKAAELLTAMEEAVAEWQEENQRILLEENQLEELDSIATVEETSPVEVAIDDIEEPAPVEVATETPVEESKVKEATPSRVCFGDVLQAPLASEPGMDIWADVAVCRQTGQRFELQSEIVDFLEDGGVWDSMTQKVMESGFYPKFYEKLFRPRLTQLVTRRPVSADIELSLELLQPQSDWVILDVACGTGNFSRALAQSLHPEKGFVVGLDGSQNMLEEAAELRTREDLWNLFFVRGDALQLPFGDATFDAINCTAALHLFEEPAAALAEFHRVLKPGGRVVIGTFLMSENAVMRRAQEFGRDYLGFGWFDYADLLNKLEYAGFQLRDESIDGLAISLLVEK